METMFLQSYMAQSSEARGCHSTHTSMWFSSQMEGPATKRTLLGSWCGAMLLVCIDFGLCMGRPCHKSPQSPLRFSTELADSG